MIKNLLIVLMFFDVLVLLYWLIEHGAFRVWPALAFVLLFVVYKVLK